MRKDKLTLSKIETPHGPGVLNDGGGLFLYVTAGGAKSWCFRFTLGGRRRMMGLGGFDKRDLPAARERARECRELVEHGIDPMDYRRGDRTLAGAKTPMSFKKAALAYIEAHKDGWSVSNAQKWLDQFELYVFPQIGVLPMRAVNDADVVLKVLEPIWTTLPATASALRGRIEMVINWAKFRGYCTGENAARWKGHLELHLPRPGQVRGVRHYPALPYRDVPGFLQKLRQQRGIVAVALEFTLFTVGRQNETRWARWPEFDLDAGIWTIPGERMKMRREHRVALNEPALAVLRKVAQRKRSGDDFVFPGLKTGKPLSQHVMKTLMRCMGYAGIATAHGFRSSFKDWASEQTDFSTEAIELALAHTVGNKVEAAYRRGDLLEKRRLLSKAWGDFCLGLTPPAASNLIPFPRPDDRATKTVPAAASNSQKQPQKRQLRSLPLAAETAALTVRSPQKRRRVPRTADREQLSLDFGPAVEQPVSRTDGRPLPADVPDNVDTQPSKIADLFT
jgi:integrase